jgi:hypothetical protein
MYYGIIKELLTKTESNTHYLYFDLYVKRVQSDDQFSDDIRSDVISDLLALYEHVVPVEEIRDKCKRQLLFRVCFLVSKVVLSTAFQGAQQFLCVRRSLSHSSARHIVHENVNNHQYLSHQIVSSVNILDALEQIKHTDAQQALKANVVKMLLHVEFDHEPIYYDRQFFVQTRMDNNKYKYQPLSTMIERVWREKVWKELFQYVDEGMDCVVVS